MPLGGYHIYVVILSPFTWSIYSNHLGQQSSGISTYNAWAPVFVPRYGPKSVTIIASCHFSLTEFMGKGGGLGADDEMTYDLRAPRSRNGLSIW